MNKQKYEVNMLEGSIFKSIVLFALPLILSNLLQVFYNAADIIIVGQFAGSAAMASVGATGSISALIVNTCIGLSVGASVLVARRFGAGHYDGIHRAVHSSILLSFYVGIFAMLVGIIFSSPLLKLLGTPKGKVLDGAVLYMQIYFLGIPATLVYNFGAAILRAVGDTKRPLYILLLTGIVNIVLNLIFVIKFKMGVAGVAIATSVASYLSAIAVILVLRRADGPYKLSMRKLKIYKKELKECLTIGVPAGLQSSVFSLANSVIQSAVNSFGTAAIAGCAAAANIEGFVYTAMNSFHHATLTAVGQNYGAKNEKRMKKSIGVALICVAIVGAFLGVMSAIFSKSLLGIYITDSEEAIKFGITRLYWTCTPYFLCGIMDVLAGVLRGMGRTVVPALNSLVGACGLRLLWIFFILPLNRSISVLFMCWPVSWIVVILMHSLYYLYIRKDISLELKIQNI